MNFKKVSKKKNAVTQQEIIPKDYENNDLSLV